MVGRIRNCRVQKTQRNYRVVVSKCDNKLHNLTYKCLLRYLRRKKRPKRCQKATKNETDEINRRYVGCRLFVVTFHNTAMVVNNFIYVKYSKNHPANWNVIWKLGWWRCCVQNFSAKRCQNTTRHLKRNWKNSQHRWNGELRLIFSPLSPRFQSPSIILDDRLGSFDMLPRFCKAANEVHRYYRARKAISQTVESLKLNNN